MLAMSWLLYLILLRSVRGLEDSIQEPGACVETSGNPSFLQHALQLNGSPGAEHATTHSLFVKFHKVAGSTWADYVNAMTGEPWGCTWNCGSPHWICERNFPPSSTEHKKCRMQYGVLQLGKTCPYTPHSCTFHTSLGVIYEALLGQDLTAPEGLWPDTKRLELLWGVEWARTWLPTNLQGRRLVVTTILRDPTEKLRSYYYFANEGASRRGFQEFLRFRRDFVAGNWTQEEFDKQAAGDNKPAMTLNILNDSVGEYQHWLGNGSVEQSKLALSTQFDLVAITEEMNAGLVSLGKLYGLSLRETVMVRRNTPDDLDNSDNKLDWTDEELAIAKYVTANSQEVYRFGQDLADQQHVRLFGSREDFESALATFEENLNS
mmetsp:Transcript_36943/g.68862  ORF Transcript_36943/g.68862 Transcript_36943/m.68862 type:complete len:377 (-) Transcript_36943:141-1271(-)